jgi:hypothetical protein
LTDTNPLIRRKENPLHRFVYEKNDNPSSSKEEGSKKAQIKNNQCSNPDPDSLGLIRIQTGQWIRIQKGKNEPKKDIKKVKKCHVSKCYTFSFEG